MRAAFSNIWGSTTNRALFAYYCFAYQQGNLNLWCLKIIIYHYFLEQITQFSHLSRPFISKENEQSYRKYNSTVRLKDLRAGTMCWFQIRIRNFRNKSIRIGKLSCLEGGAQIERRHASILAADAAALEGRFPQVCWQTRGWLPSQEIQLLGSISVHGICSAHVSWQLKRHRSMLASSAEEDVSPRLSWTNISQHIGWCEWLSQLEDLRWFRLWGDSWSP